MKQYEEYVWIQGKYN